jgi:phosphoenolpyruvate-protein phosphotransferase (PTS system enzyme I)
MSFAIHGIGVAGGIAIGRAHLIAHSVSEIAHYAIPATRVPAEIGRLDAAFRAVRDELEQLQRNVPDSAPAEFGAFLNLHLMILNDPTLSEAPRALIKQQRCNAEWALKQEMDNLLEQFEKIEDVYLRERKADVTQVVERVLKALLGLTGSLPAIQTDGERRILVAHDLSPADVILFKEQHFAAFVTDVGGATSHTAIIARSLNIPSVVALHHAWTLVRENEVLIVDGVQGVVLVDPDETVLTEYRLRQEQWELERQKLRRLKLTPAVTMDGTAVELHANIELPEDMESVAECGATGIGLFRSEFLFMNRHDLPSEDEQFEAYRRVVVAMEGRPVTIRTLDIGADKNLDGAAQVGINPALGLRAIRYCLAEPALFNTQLRAILRASHYGRVRLLIPMLSSVAEISNSRGLIESAKEQLRAESIPFDEAIAIGGMIEVPAAALAVDGFLKRLSFLSIGTNDLIQYTLAIDRADDAVAHLYNPLHPAVLLLVSMTIKAANRAHVPVAVCGEMAGDELMTRLLLGFGLRQFSMHPAHILAVKRRVLQTSIPEAEAFSKRILQMEDSDKVERLLTRMNA